MTLTKEAQEAISRLREAAKLRRDHRMGGNFEGNRMYGSTPAPWNRAAAGPEYYERHDVPEHHLVLRGVSELGDLADRLDALGKLMPGVNTAVARDAIEYLQYIVMELGAESMRYSDQAREFSALAEDRFVAGEALLEQLDYEQGHVKRARESTENLSKMGIRLSEVAGELERRLAREIGADAARKFHHRVNVKWERKIAEMTAPKDEA